MQTINLNGKEYILKSEVKKEEVKLTKEMVTNYLKENDEWDFVDIAQDVAEHHIGKTYFDCADLVSIGNSTDKQLTMIMMTKHIG